MSKIPFLLQKYDILNKPGINALLYQTNVESLSSWNTTLRNLKEIILQILKELILRIKQKNNLANFKRATNYTAKTKCRKPETNIPRKGISGPQSQFPHSCVCERIIYSHDGSAFSAGGNMWTDSGNIINNSQERKYNRNCRCSVLYWSLAEPVVCLSSRHFVGLREKR